MSRIHVLHENSAWLPPLAQAFDQRRLPWTEWFLDAGTFDLAAPPPQGVFYNRMSASSHTRDHRFSAELTAAVLAWLTRWDRRVVNGPGALDLEISKARQYAALESHGIATPRTVLVAGRDHVCAAARRHFVGQPVILKPNRGGKGLGVQLFLSSDSLAAYLAGDAYEAPVDGLHLLQEYVRAPRPFITRAEFVGGRFLYAVEVDTSDGFELCPADACAIGDANCPVGEAPRREIHHPRRHSRRAARSPRALPDGDRRRGGGHRVHHRHRRPHAGLRREHQHELQPRRGGARRPHRHGAIGSRRDRGIPRPRAAATARCGLTIIRAVSCWPLHSCAHHLRSSFGRCRHSQQCVACRGHSADHGNLREPPYPLRSGRRRIGASGSRAGERPARASRWRHVEPPHVCHIAL